MRIPNPSSFVVAILLFASLASLQADDFRNRVNELLREGRMTEAVTYLEEQLQNSSGANRALIEKMLEQLKAHRSPSPEPPSPTPQTTPTPAQADVGGGRWFPYIRGLGGYPGYWMFWLGYSWGDEPQQVWHHSKGWPQSWIKAQWDRGYSIDHVSGDSAEWLVVMGKRKRHEPQGYMGPRAFDDTMQTYIADFWDKGYGISNVAGWKQSWVIVMTKRPGLSNDQRFSMPGDFGDSRLQWIRARWDDGYVITSAAGDYTGDPGKGEMVGSFVFVMSRGQSQQTISRPLAPQAFVDWTIPKREEGYGFAALLGYKKFVRGVLTRPVAEVPSATPPNGAPPKPTRPTVVFHIDPVVALSDLGLPPTP